MIKSKPDGPVLHRLTEGKGVLVPRRFPIFRHFFTTLPRDRLMLLRAMGCLKQVLEKRGELCETKRPAMGRRCHCKCGRYKLIWER